MLFTTRFGFGDIVRERRAAYAAVAAFLSNGGFTESVYLLGSNEIRGGDANRCLEISLNWQSNDGVMPYIGETRMPILIPTRIGTIVVVCAVLGLLPIVVLVGKAHAQSSAVETQRQTPSQLEDERELLADLVRSPLMQLKPRFKTLSLNREFGKIDADTEDSQSLPALSFVKIVETRRAPEFGPLWSMVVAVRQNGTPLRTHDGKMIKGWARTDHFDPPDLTEPKPEPSPKVSVVPTSVKGVRG